jgi:hypothetical protein
MDRVAIGLPDAVLQCVSSAGTRRRILLCRYQHWNIPRGFWDDEYVGSSYMASGGHLMQLLYHGCFTDMTLFVPGSDFTHHKILVNNAGAGRSSRH